MARSNILLASVVFHGALAGAVATLRPEVRREITAISVSESTKPKPEEPPPAAEPPKEATVPDAPRPARQAKQAARAAAAPEAAKSPSSGASAMDALPDFGLSLSGGTGSGPGGVAVPAGGAAPAEPKAVAAAPKVLAAKAPADDCAEATVKPKPQSISQPAYTASAREAGVEGKVRVEVTVDERGKVSKARLLSGLGHGLDEAALAAARAATFHPATRCGKPVAATFVIAMRFSL